MGFNLTGFARGLAATDPAGFYLRLKDMEMRQQQAANAQEEFGWRRRDQQQRQDFQDFSRDQMEKVGSTVTDNQYITPDQGGLAGQTPEQALARQGDATPTQADVRRIDNASTVQTNPRNFTRADAYDAIGKKAAGFDLERSIALAKMARDERTRDSVSEIYDHVKNMSDAELAAEYGDKITNHAGNSVGFTVKTDPKTHLTQLIAFDQKSGASRAIDRDELLTYLVSAAQLGNGNYLEGLSLLQNAREMGFKSADAEYKRNHGLSQVVTANNNAIHTQAQIDAQRAGIVLKAKELAASLELMGTQNETAQYGLKRMKEVDELSSGLSGPALELNNALATGDSRRIAAATSAYNAAVATISARGGKVPQMPFLGGKQKLESSVESNLGAKFAEELSMLDPSKPDFNSQVTKIQRKYSAVGLNTGYVDPVASVLPKPGEAFPLSVDGKTDLKAKDSSQASGGLKRQMSDGTGDVLVSKNPSTGKTVYTVDGLPGRFNSRAEAEAEKRRSGVGLSPVSRSIQMYGD
jgi:hypothetical protein